MWLLFCTDDRYARPLGVAIRSVFDRLTAPARAIVVLDAVSDDNRSRLERTVPEGADVRFVDAATLETRGLTGARHVTAATYLRLFADVVMPADADRVLFLDADTLSLADVAQLYRLDMEGKAVAAVRDMVIADSDHQYSGTTSPGAHAPYFNAGVLLIDLVRWRRDGLGSRLRDYVHARPGHGNFDQEALNDLLRHDWQELDPIWNVQGSLLLLHEHPANEWVDELRHRRRELLERAAIVHFSGGIKPWHPSSRHPFRGPWRRELRDSGWLTRREYARWTTELRTKSALITAATLFGQRETRESATR